MKNQRRFIATAEESEALRSQCRSLRKMTDPPAFHYGWFFDSSGWAQVEQLSPRTIHNYVFRTDSEEDKASGT